MTTKTTEKKDPAAELALKLVAALEELRTQGTDAYPSTVQHLAQRSESPIPPDILQKVIKKAKGFLDKVVVVRRGDPLSPVALQDDAPALVENPRVLDYLLRLARTPTNQALSVSQLKIKVSGQLKNSFAVAANRLMDNNRLPPGIVWIYVNRTRKLFLMEDLHGQVQPSTEG